MEQGEYVYFQIYGYSESKVLNDFPSSSVKDTTGPELSTCRGNIAGFPVFIKTFVGVCAITVGTAVIGLG